jgi:cytochrome P450
MALPGSLRAQVGGWTHDIRFLLEPGMMTAADFARVVEVVEQFAAELTLLIRDRRQNPGKDLISQLGGARTGSGDQLSEEELTFVCIMCFVAGNETTKALIGNGLAALLGHPEQAALLRSDPSRVPGAVGEALRYDSPLQMTKRIALREKEIDGHRIAEGDQVLLCLGSANRDAEVFAEPDEFDITRDTGRHLAFGHGMHGCLGGLLAQAQAGALLTSLAQRPESLEGVANQRQYQEHSFIVRGLKELPVVVRKAE